MTKEERIQKAVALFKEGYNCSQSVVGAYADMYGFTFEQALHMAASFGGGIGRMREICGAACGMFLLAGLERCAVDGADREGKAANYKLVQELAEKFKEECGTIRCSNFATVQCIRQILLVYQASPTGINQNSGRLHQVQFLSSFR